MTLDTDNLALPIARSATRKLILSRVTQWRGPVGNRKALFAAQRLGHGREGVWEATRGRIGLDE